MSLYSHISFGGCDGVTCGDTNGTSTVDSGIVDALKGLDIEVSGADISQDSDPVRRGENEYKTGDKSDPFANDEQKDAQSSSSSSGSGQSSSSGGENTANNSSDLSSNPPETLTANNDDRKKKSSLSDVDTSTNSQLASAQNSVDEDGESSKSVKDKLAQRIGGLFYSGEKDNYFKSAGQPPGQSLSGDKKGNVLSSDLGSGYFGAATNGTRAQRGLGYDKVNAGKSLSRRLRVENKAGGFGENLLRNKWRNRRGGRSIASKKSASLFNVICNQYDSYAKENSIQNISGKCPK